MDFHILNIDLLATRDLAIQYGVTAIPNIVLLDAEGNLVLQFLGYQTEETLQAAVADLVEPGA